MTHPILALDGASLHLPDGSVLFSNLHHQFDLRRTGLVGRNGVGKSMLARLLAGAGQLRAQSTIPASLTGYTSASATALTAAFRSLLGIDPPVHEVALPLPAGWPPAPASGVHI